MKNLKSNAIVYIVVFVFFGLNSLAENEIPKNKVIDDLLNCKYPIGVVLATEIATTSAEFSYYSVENMILVHVPYYQIYNDSNIESSALLMYSQNRVVADTIIAIPYNLERIENSQYFISEDKFCSTIGECNYTTKFFKISINSKYLLAQIDFNDSSVLFDSWIDSDEIEKLKPYLNKEISHRYRVVNYLWSQDIIVGINVEEQIYFLRYDSSIGYSMEKQVIYKEMMFK